MRNGIFCLALVTVLLLSCVGCVAAPVEAGTNIWTQSSDGMYGGIIIALAISPNYATDSTIFAGTSGGGVYKSTNSGSS